MKTIYSDSKVFEVKKPYFSLKHKTLVTSFLFIVFTFNFEIYSQSISAGYIHSIASNKDGQIYYWGSELGTRIYEGTKTPVNISDIDPFHGKNIKQVAAGLDHSLALTTDGLVYAWGGNNYGNLGNNSTDESHIPVAVLNLSGIVAISTSAEHSLALKSDGTVWAWGKGLNGELGDGHYYSEPPYGSPVPVAVSELDNIIAISAGSSASIALRSDGKVFTWGSGSSGGLGNGSFDTDSATPVEVPGLQNIVSVSFGSLHALALKNDGTVYSWGTGTSGQLGNGIVYNKGISGVASPVQVLQLKDIISIDAGYSHSLALKNDGTVYAWGNGNSGNLGDGIVVNFDAESEEHIVSLPVKIPNLRDIAEISAGSFSLMRHQSGIIYACGSTFFGELGTGDSYSTSPWGIGKPTVVKDLDLDNYEDLRKGKILWEQWLDITGGITDIPSEKAPHNEKVIKNFESPYNIGNSYGSRVRAYIFPPVTGEYTFYVASDDHSQLWLSTTDDPKDKVQIAFINGNTLRNQWNKYASQKSAKINLEAGKKYYIEALHKENSGVDHLSVAWQLPDGQREAPIPAHRLSAFSLSEYIEPHIQITSPSADGNVAVNAPLIMTAKASYPFGTIEKVEFYAGEEKIGEDLTDPYSVSFSPLYSGDIKLTARAVSSDATYGSAEIHVSAAILSAECDDTGSILWEQWTGLPAGGIETIPFNEFPSSSRKLTLFDSKPNIGNYYGSRFKGYICPPITGNYTFYVSSDDYSELWLSTDSNMANKVKIASITGFSAPEQWNKYASQKSSPVLLVSGQKYYVEALHKENSGRDHFTVGWELPDGTFEAPLPGSHLSPVLSFEGSLSTARSGEFEVEPAVVFNVPQLSAFPNPFNTDIQINFIAEQSGKATLKVYDLNGTLIKNIFEGNTEAGTSYDFNFSSGEKKTGIFVCRLVNGNQIYNLKLIKL